MDADPPIRQKKPPYRGLFLFHYTTHLGRFTTLLGTFTTFTAQLVAYMQPMYYICLITAPIRGLKPKIMKVLKFHTGRGGRFNDSGFVKFVGFERIDEGKAYEECWFDDNGELVEGNGNSIEAEINEDGTGYINHDHDYDTTTCVLGDDLDEKQIDALIRESDGGFHNKEASAILKEYYSEYIDQL